MDEQAGQERPVRRAGLRPLPTPTDIEIIVEDGPPLLEVIDDLPEPRIAELDALLREVDNLRSTMRRDLTLAATAADAGADDLAGWLLLGSDGEVRAFEERALSRLHALQAADEADQADETAAAALIPAPRRVARMLPAAPLVAAAAAVIGFLTGGIPGTGGSPVTSPKTSNAAQSYAQLTALAANGASASRISAAAERFHSDLAPLVATASSNPAAAMRAIDLLQSERAVIAGEADSPALRAVLAQADLLVRKLRAKLPHSTVVVPVGPGTNSGSRSSSAPKSSASAKPSPSPSPKPSPKPSPSASPKPSSSASPSSSPSDGGPFPGTLPH
ncbi:MAG: hypothetical protein QOI82_2464 [Actinomycetota bacterium]|nr:hypothetical protein [Actinomycetota bacterium]